MQTSPEVYTPTCAPTCGLVALYLQRTFCSLLQGGISKMIARIEPDEVTLVAMLEIPVVPVVVPLVQVAHMADGVGVQLGQGLLHLFILLSENLTSSDGVDKQFADDSQVGSTAIACCAVIALVSLILVLGRCTWGCNQFARLFGVVDEPTQTELGCTLHQWISSILKILLVLSELITFPKCVYKPCSTKVPV